MVNYSSRETVPYACITKGKQRIKQYGQTVYLNNSDEFEIELFNPTSNKVLAEIQIDGKPIGARYGAGVILRPGERIFLERYLHLPSKFKFETYEVDSNDVNAQNAITNNGVVDIKFFTEKIVDYFYGNTLTWSSSGSYNSTVTSTGGPIMYKSTFTAGDQNQNWESTGQKIYQKLSKPRGIVGNNSENIMFLSASLDDNDTYERSFAGASADFAPMETGRVEKGGHSNQRFQIDNTEFNPLYSWRYEWKILPMSRKPVESEDLKVFCVKCGMKRRKSSHNFCPKCGTKY